MKLLKELITMINSMISLLENYSPLFIEGLKVTIIVASVGTIGGLIIGMIIYFFRSLTINFTDNWLVKSMKKVLSIFAIAYIDIMRGTPMIVQASIFWFGFASHLNMNVVVAAIVIVSFNTAGYIAEIIRSGIIALGNGAFEAAQSLGMTRFQTMVYVIFPQVLKNSLPSLLNELIVNVKDSSVLSIIGLTDLFYSARGASSSTFQQEPAYILVAIMYFILTFALSKIITIIIDSKNKNCVEVGESL
ncbi:His/Glu/Gln/Arg/opine family amino acid ABC transporter permease subunit [Bacilli bacterium PM5-9]|nr:His/Glu/Gln/Arg/opine family amino acid ABC transporter permease subunit [Bacilli bacterium PM5-9]